MKDITTTIADELLPLYGLDPQNTSIEPGDHEHTFKLVNAHQNLFLKLVDTADFDHDLFENQQLYMTRLRQKGLPVLNFLKGTSGNSFSSFDHDQKVALISPWVDGKTLLDTTQPGLWESVGRLIAEIHRAVDGFTLPTPGQIQNWSEVYLAQGPWFDSFLSQATLSKEQAEHFTRGRDFVQDIEKNVPKQAPAYGLIHADMHLDNLLFDGQKIWILDFEEFGLGHNYFDLAWSMMLYKKRGGDLELYKKHLSQGYQEIRVFSPKELEHHNHFMVAAGLAALEMILSSGTDPTSDLAHHWIDFTNDFISRHLP